MTAEQDQNLANYPNITSMETSAKLGINVEEAFTVISDEIYNKLDRGEYRGLGSKLDILKQQTLVREDEWRDRCQEV